MPRPKGSKNKPKENTVPTTTTKTAAPQEALADIPTSKGELAVFTPPRLPYDHRIEDKFGIDVGQWKVLTEAIYPAAKTVDSILMVLNYCASRKLDPFKRPVHIVPMWDSQRGAMVETVWPGISELRTTASRTKGYAGIDAAEFGDEVETEFTGRVKENGNWVDKKMTVEHPVWCRMTVYRFVNGQRFAFVGPKVRWLETYATQGRSELPNNMWETRPEGQLEKCAEAAALRRAFPEEIGNELTAEEMAGRTINELAHDVQQIAGGTTANQDAGPPRAITKAEPPKEEINPDQNSPVESVTEARDGEPPPRKASAAPKEDPISSGPPRSAPKPAATKDNPPTEIKAAPKTAAQGVQPHRIPGTGHSFESWAEKYIEFIQTSEDTATVYKWIDLNSAKTQNAAGEDIEGPLVRLEKLRPAVYSKIRKATENTMEALRDASAKKAAKAETKTKAATSPPPADMDDDAPPPRQDTMPTNPETILKQIDAELAAVEDPEQLQAVWDNACEPLVAKLDFPPDQDAAQGIFNKHEKRLGGD